MSDALPCARPPKAVARLSPSTDAVRAVRRSKRSRKVDEATPDTIAARVYDPPTIPRRERGMPREAEKSGPSGITIMKSRMLTNCTPATSSTTARSETGRGGATPARVTYGTAMRNTGPHSTCSSVMR